MYTRYVLVNLCEAYGTLGSYCTNNFTMGVKDFLIKKAAERQLKDMPKEQRDMVMTLLENNPDLFVKMSKEVEHKIKKEGKDQTLAMMEVSKKYQKELQAALGGQQQKFRP